jgi:hypothetical protein
MKIETDADIERLFKDCQEYAEELRPRNIQSGPWWPIIARFVPLFDIANKMRCQLKGVKIDEGDLSRQIQEVLELKKKHLKTWREKDDLYWTARLMEEVGELASSLVGHHDHSPDWELAQISAICLNWLEKRAQEADHGEKS